MKIGLCGTMSIGKTTLINELSKLPFFKDYHIATERSKYLRDLGIPLNTDSSLKGQTIFLAERCSELLHENLLADRTVLDVMAFTKCAKSINDLQKLNYLEYTKQFIPEYDYIFYVSPLGTQIENNKVRETDNNYRNLIDFTIKHLIKDNLYNIKNYGILSGSTEQRIEQLKYYLKF